MTTLDHSPAHAAHPPRASRAQKVVLAGLGVATAASLVAGGVAVTGAYFTDQATVGGQSVTAATVDVVAGTATSSAPISAGSLLPGDTASTDLTLSNEGSEDVYYTIRLPRVTTGDAALEAAVQVSVTVGSVTETRTLSAWQAGALQLGAALEADDDQAVEVSVELPTAADNTLQGLEAGFTVQVDAIQARNTTAPTAGWVAD